MKKEPQTLISDFIHPHSYSFHHKPDKIDKLGLSKFDQYLISTLRPVVDDDRGNSSDQRPNGIENPCPIVFLQMIEHLIEILEWNQGRRIQDNLLKVKEVWWEEWVKRGIVVMMIVVAVVAEVHNLLFLWNNGG